MTLYLEDRAEAEEVRHPRVKGNVLDTHSLGQSSECVC